MQLEKSNERQEKSRGGLVGLMSIMLHLQGCMGEMVCPGAFIGIRNSPPPKTSCFNLSKDLYNLWIPIINKIVRKSPFLSKAPPGPSHPFRHFLRAKMNIRMEKWGRGFIYFTLFGLLFWGAMSPVPDAFKSQFYLLSLPVLFLCSLLPFSLSFSSFFFTRFMELYCFLLQLCIVGVFV